MVCCTIMRASQAFRDRTVQSGVGDRCIVRYDNEAGTGDHRHYGDREESYRSESLEKLLEDFREDCTRLAGWRWR